MTTIQMDAPTKAFYAGVAAGEDALTTVISAENFADQPFEIRLSFFWLHVGAALADEKIAPEHHHLFVTGAGTRKPQREHAFTLELDLSGIAFVNTDNDSVFEDYIQPWTKNRLSSVARHDMIDGEGDIYDGQSRKVGTYRFHE